MMMMMMWLSCLQELRWGLPRAITATTGAWECGWYLVGTQQTSTQQKNFGMQPIRGSKAPDMTKQANSPNRRFETRLLVSTFFGWTVESTCSNWDTPNTWIVFQLKSTEDMKIWFEVVEGCFVPSFQAGKLFCEHPMCFAPCKCDLIVMWLVRFACKTASTTLRARASAWAKFIVVQNVVKQRSRIHILGCWMLGSWWYLPLENMSDAVQYQKDSRTHSHPCILQVKFASSGPADVGFGSELVFEESWKMEPLFGMQLLYPCESMCRGWKVDTIHARSCPLFEKSRHVGAGSGEGSGIFSVVRHKVRARQSLQAPLTRGMPEWHCVSNSGWIGFWVLAATWQSCCYCLFKHSARLLLPLKPSFQSVAMCSEWPCL